VFLKLAPLNCANSTLASVRSTIIDKEAVKKEVKPREEQQTTTTEANNRS
jgi:hypothetical protein